LEFILEIVHLVFKVSFQFPKLSVSCKYCKIWNNWERECW